MREREIRRGAGADQRENWQHPPQGIVRSALFAFFIPAAAHQLGPQGNQPLDSIGHRNLIASFRGNAQIFTFFPEIESCYSMRALE
jgi:hypothetical protein